MSRNTVKLSFPLGERGVSLHCPACGKAMMDDEQTAENPCEHLAFVYLGEIPDFSYVSPKLTKLAESALDSDDPVKEASKKLDEKTSVVFQVETSGVACGPVSSTAVLAFVFEGL